MAVASYAPAAGEAGLSGEVLSGVLSFLKVAFGGLAVGFLMAWAIFWLIGSITSKEQVEISLSLVLAYAAFMVAEHFLHVSGVMATVAAGLTAGTYGKTKVSPSVEHFMHGFWEYMGFVMNSLIFFFVGLVISRQLSLADFEHWLPVLLTTLVAVIAARAVGVFGSVPLVQRFTDPIGRGYQTVMFWGGLRGAVSLALALAVFTNPALPEPARKGVLVLASAVVLFTLLVNALTMEPLIKTLGLDRPTAADRFALAYAGHERVEVGAKVLGRIKREGAVLPEVLERLQGSIDRRRASARENLGGVRDSVGSDPVACRAVADRVALALEKGDVLHRFHAGQLTEGATKVLLSSADVLLDRVKRGEELPEERKLTLGYGGIESKLLSLLEPLPVLGALARSVRAQRLGEDVEATRALYLAGRSVQRSLAGIEEGGGLDQIALARVQARYAAWTYKAEERFQRLVKDFPDYALESQTQLAELQTIRAERHSLHHLAEAGLMTDKALAEAKDTLISREADLLAASRTTGIDLGPAKLLRAVPAFAELDEAHVAALAGKLVSRTFLEGEDVVTEGDAGDSMFLIARGAAGVFTKKVGGADVPLHTFGAGEFFGEIAALLGGTRRATVRALTPVNLLELTRSALREVLADNPELDEQVRASIYPRAIGRALVDCPGLGALSPEQRTGLALQFAPESHASGETLGSPEEPARLTYVAEGKVVRGTTEVGDGVVFGAQALLGKPEPEAVATMTEVNLLVLPAEVAAGFREEHPEVARAIEEALQG
jgi:CPA1 family monovalent cation:H+ antiporter